jgi:hypothetical protein
VTLVTAAVPEYATIGPLDWICASGAGLVWRRPGESTIGGSMLDVPTWLALGVRVIVWVFPTVGREGLVVTGTDVFSVRALLDDLDVERLELRGGVGEPDVVSIATPLALAITASPVAVGLASAEAAATPVARRPTAAARNRRRAQVGVLESAWESIVRSGCW